MKAATPGSIVVALVVAVSGACSGSEEDTGASADGPQASSGADDSGTVSGTGGAGAVTTVGAAGSTPAAMRGGTAGAHDDAEPADGGNASDSGGEADAGEADSGGDSTTTADAGRIEAPVLVVEGEPEPSFEPIALADFCSASAEALCAGEDACGCEPPPIAPCVERAAMRCETGILDAATLAHIDEGRSFYDPEAAGLLVATLRRLMTRCEQALPQFEFVKMIGTMGVLGGSEPVGTRCGYDTGSFACRLGYCQNVGDFILECRSDVPGEVACSRMGVCPHEELPRLRCDGAPCPEDFLGEPCARPSDCQSAQCVNGRCVDRAPLGASCANHARCASLNCMQGVCSESGAPLGATCQVEYPSCESAHCRDGACAAGVCRFYDNGFLP